MVRTALDMKCYVLVAIAVIVISARYSEEADSIIIIDSYNGGPKDRAFRKHVRKMESRKIANHRYYVQRSSPKSDLEPEPTKLVDLNHEDQQNNSNQSTAQPNVTVAQNSSNGHVKRSPIRKYQKGHKQHKFQRRLGVYTNHDQHGHRLAKNLTSPGRNKQKSDRLLLVAATSEPVEDFDSDIKLPKEPLYQSEKEETVEIPKSAVKRTRIPKRRDQAEARQSSDEVINTSFEKREKAKVEDTPPLQAERRRANTTRRHITRSRHQRRREEDVDEIQTVDTWPGKVLPDDTYKPNQNVADISFTTQQQQYYETTTPSYASNNHRKRTKRPGFDNQKLIEDFYAKLSQITLPSEQPTAKQPEVTVYPLGVVDHGDLQSFPKIENIGSVIQILDLNLDDKKQGGKVARDAAPPQDEDKTKSRLRTRQRKHKQPTRVVEEETPEEIEYQQNAYKAAEEASHKNRGKARRRRPGHLKEDAKPTEEVQLDDDTRSHEPTPSAEKDDPVRSYIQQQIEKEKEVEPQKAEEENYPQRNSYRMRKRKPVHHRVELERTNGEQVQEPKIIHSNFFLPHLPDQENKPVALKQAQHEAEDVDYHSNDDKLHLKTQAPTVEVIKEHQINHRPSVDFEEQLNAFFKHENLHNSKRRPHQSAPVLFENEEKPKHHDENEEPKEVPQQYKTNPDYYTFHQGNDAPAKSSNRTRKNKQPQVHAIGDDLLIAAVPQSDVDVFKNFKLQFKNPPPKPNKESGGKQRKVKQHQEPQLDVVKSEYDFFRNLNLTTSSPFNSFVHISLQNQDYPIATSHPFVEQRPEKAKPQPSPAPTETTQHSHEKESQQQQHNVEYLADLYAQTKKPAHGRHAEISYQSSSERTRAKDESRGRHPHRDYSEKTRGKDETHKSEYSSNANRHQQSDEEPNKHHHSEAKTSKKHHSRGGKTRGSPPTDNHELRLGLDADIYDLVKQADSDSQNQAFGEVFSKLREAAKHVKKLSKNLNLIRPATSVPTLETFFQDQPSGGFEGAEKPTAEALTVHQHHHNRTKKTQSHQKKMKTFQQLNEAPAKIVHETEPEEEQQKESYYHQQNNYQRRPTKKTIDEGYNHHGKQNGYQNLPQDQIIELLTKTLPLQASQYINPTLTTQTPQPTPLSSYKNDYQSLNHHQESRREHRHKTKQQPADDEFFPSTKYPTENQTYQIQTEDSFPVLTQGQLNFLNNLPFVPVQKPPYYNKELQLLSKEAEAEFYSKIKGKNGRVKVRPTQLTETASSSTQGDFAGFEETSEAARKQRPNDESQQKPKAFGSLEEFLKAYPTERANTEKDFGLYSALRYGPVEFGKVPTLPAQIFDLRRQAWSDQGELPSSQSTQQTFQYDEIFNRADKKSGSPIAGESWKPMEAAGTLYNGADIGGNLMPLYNTFRELNKDVKIDNLNLLGTMLNADNLKRNDAFADDRPKFVMSANNGTNADDAKNKTMAAQGLPSASLLENMVKIAMPPQTFPYSFPVPPNFIPQHFPIMTVRYDPSRDLSAYYKQQQFELPKEWKFGVDQDYKDFLNQHYWNDNEMMLKHVMRRDYADHSLGDRFGEEIGSFYNGKAWDEPTRPVKTVQDYMSKVAPVVQKSKKQQQQQQHHNTFLIAANNRRNDGESAESSSSEEEGEEEVEEEVTSPKPRTPKPAADKKEEAKREQPSQGRSPKRGYNYSVVEREAERARPSNDRPPSNKKQKFGEPPDHR